MIKLNIDTERDFLKPSIIKTLINVGADLSNTKYFIDDNLNVLYRKDCKKVIEVCPTLTIDELYDRLPDYLEVSIEGKKFYGDLHLNRYDNIWIAYYKLRNKRVVSKGDLIEYNENYLKTGLDTPIEALGALLIQCYLKGILKT